MARITRMLNLKNASSHTETGDTAVAEQLKSLVDTLSQWKEEQDKADNRRAHQLELFIAKTAGIVSFIIGVGWSAVEFGIWYYDKVQIENMAEKYSNVGDEIFTKENNPDIAMQMIEKAIELDDNSFEYRFQYAYIKSSKAIRTLLNLDRPLTKEELDTAHSALADAKFLKQLRPKRAEGYILESQIYTSLKDYSAAEESIKTALQLSPDNSYAKVRYATLLYSLKRYDDAQKMTEQAMKDDPKSKWAYMWHGLVCYAKKDMAQAKTSLEKAVEIDPKFDMGYFNLGMYYLNSRPRQFDNARDFFQKAAAINPGYAASFYQIGMSYGYQDRYDIALTYMNKAIALSPDYLTARNWKALVLFEMKRFEEAQEEYGRAIELDPRNDQLYVRRASALSKLKKYDEAIQDLDFALELNAQNVQAVSALSKIYLETKNYSLAEKRIHSAIAMTQTPAVLSDLYSVLSAVYEAQGKTEAAIQAQTKSVETHCGKITLQRRAVLYWKNKQVKEALSDIEKIHAADARYLPAWKLEIQIQKDLSPEKALNAINKYLELCPQDENIKSLRNRLQNESKTAK